MGSRRKLSSKYMVFLRRTASSVRMLKGVNGESPRYYRADTWYYLDALLVQL